MKKKNNGYIKDIFPVFLKKCDMCGCRFKNIWGYKVKLKAIRCMKTYYFCSCMKTGIGVEKWVNDLEKDCEEFEKKHAKHRILPDIPWPTR